MDCDAISFSRHALQRMFERAISPDEIRKALANGETVADYPEDTPYPSRLILGIVAGGRFMWWRRETIQRSIVT